MKCIKYLFLLLIATPIYALAPIQYGPLQADRYFDNTGGFIDHISPLLIDKKHASAIQNITMDDRGQLSKRKGYTVIQSTYALAGPSTWAVVGATFHKAATGTDFFAVVVGTDVYRLPSPYVAYSKITGTVVLTNSITNLAQTTHLQDFSIFCNDSDKPFYVAPTGNATTISTNTFDTAKTCGTYGNYLVVANTSEGSVLYPNRVRWSDLNNINSFPALNYFDIESNDGDKVVSIIAFDDFIYIFKKHSIYRMLITGLDGPDAFIIRPVARNIGAWAKNSVKVLPEVGIMFLAQNVEYLLSDRGLMPVGDPIQRTFDTIQRSQWQNAVAEVYPKRYQYWLSVSTAGSTNTEVLVYDYVQSNWTVYTNIQANMLSQSEDSSGNNILISGDYSHVTYQQDNGSSDNPGGVSTPINAYYTTANVTQDSPELTKGYKYLYVYTVGDQVYNLIVNEAYDFNSTYEHTDTVSAGSLTALYDTGVYDVDTYPASGIGVSRFELNRDARSVRLQFINSNTNQIFGLIGWAIVYAPQDFRQ